MVRIGSFRTVRPLRTSVPPTAPPGTAATTLTITTAHRHRRRAPLWAACACVVLAVSACAGVDVPSAAAPDRTPSVRLVGAFVPGGVWNELRPLRELEAELGAPLDVVHWFTSWDHAYDPVPVDALHAAGRLPLVTWQPHAQSLRDIAAGRHDAYVAAWARGVAAAEGLVYVRPFPEMNGDWVPWHGDPDAFRAAWVHVAQVFAREGAHNVRWVWSPNVTDEPRTDANRLERYYPGSDHVDVLAFSGYNWGATRPYIGWRPFEAIVAEVYPRLTALGPQPVWVAETASAEDGGDKAAWIRGMFATERFGRLEAIVWFNEDKETDWRVQSSPAALDAFSDAVRTLATEPR